MKAKKSMITLRFLVSLFLFAIVMFAFILPLSVKMYNLLAGKPKPATLDSMDLLIKEIKYLEDEQIIPIFVDDNHLIRGFDIDSGSKPQTCDEEMSCICLCELDRGCSGKGVVACRDIEHELGDAELHIDDSFSIGPTERVTNFHIEIIDGTVKITERSGIALS